MIRTKERRFAILSALCLASSVAAAQPALDTSPEALQAPIPDGYVGTRQGDENQTLVEFVRQSESLDAWTEIYTVLIVKHAAARPVEDAFAAMERASVAGCAVDPAVDQRVLARDGFDSGVGLLLCGKTRRSGTGEAFAYKVIEGEKAEYQVQHAWLLPAAAKSTDLKLTQAMLDEADGYLAQVRVCDPTHPSSGCPR